MNRNTLILALFFIFMLGIALFFGVNEEVIIPEPEPAIEILHQTVDHGLPNGDKKALIEYAPCYLVQGFMACTCILLQQRPTFFTHLLTLLRGAQ